MGFIRTWCCCVVLLHAMPLPAQFTISGTVKAAGTDSVLRFVNIGIRNKNIGTTSGEYGRFSITIPQASATDTLTFSLVGYTSLYLPLRAIQAGEQPVVWLTAKPQVLETVTIAALKPVIHTFGITAEPGLLHFTDGSTNPHDVFEIAQLIHLNMGRSKIISLNLFIEESTGDSARFRINFYRYTNGRPGERLTEKSILQKKLVTAGWLTFYLEPYSLFFEGDVVAAIEFIPTSENAAQVYYSIKPGGSGTDFVRGNSQGEWQQPPHRYRMYVSARVPGEKKHRPRNAGNDADAKPVHTIYSSAVNDSFAVFVQVPDRKKQKPAPVIFLLDANLYFEPVAFALRENRSDAILVGIGYRDFLQMDSLRNRDYTYPAALPADSFPVSGGAPRFAAFIADELIPYISRTYTTDTSRYTLMGHSLGGYFTLFMLHESLAKDRPVFKNYIAASPSLHYHNNYLLQQFREARSSSLSREQSLLVAVGEKEDESDSDSTTIKNSNALKTILQQPGYGNIKMQTVVYPGARHMETALPAFRDALESIDKQK